MKPNLKVMMTCRERINLTEKTIQSIRDNSTIFENISIYCYDNLSDLDNETRFQRFQMMLKNNLIQYYSYDTPSTLGNCFGKAVAYYKWIQQIKFEEQLGRLNKTDKSKTYYLLIDNDMIVGPKWDQYFVSAASQCPESTYFLVKFPGGIPTIAQESSTKCQVTNLFSKDVPEKFNIVHANAGGGSGFWFMTTQMLAKHVWGISEVNQTYKRFKRHDTTMWNTIRRLRGASTKYVTGVIPPDPEQPLVLHLGSVVGSMCNQLTTGQYNEDMKSRHEVNDDSIKNMTHAELFEKYKKKCYRW